MASEEISTEPIMTTEAIYKIPETPTIKEFVEVQLAQQKIIQEFISKLTEQKWIEAGCPIGRDTEFWLEAEKEIKEQDMSRKIIAKDNYNCWELVDKVVGNCDRVLLWGVSGTGKSWAARKANKNGTQVFSVSLTDDTPAAELRGHYGIIEGSYKWLDGPCILAWRRGARLVLNELEKASGDAQTFLLGILDDMEIAQQTLPNGETLTPKKGFHVVATMNGKPEEDLNPALRDRFPVCIHIDEVAPDALAKLPVSIREIAKNSGIIKEPHRKISVRVWNEFLNLRKKLGCNEAAAACIFGDRAKTVLDHLKIKKR